MFILGNLLIGVGKVLGIALDLYMWVIIVRALISWVNPDPYNPIVRFLRSVTDPLLDRIRRVAGVLGPIDFSPIIAILLIVFLRYFLVNSFVELGFKLKGGMVG